MHKGKSFYPDLVKHITPGPVVVGVVECPKAISVVRTTIGATNAAEALPCTTRGGKVRIIKRLEDQAISILHVVLATHASAAAPCFSFSSTSLV